MWAVLYFAVVTFTVVGNPFAAHREILIPVYGVVLTLPWSATVLLFKYSSATVGLATLEICALLNAAVIYAVISLVGRRSVPPAE